LWIADFPSTGFAGFGPLYQRVVDESLEDGHERLLVTPENRQGDFADLQKDAFVSSDAQAIDHVLELQI
jgi:hypothetical protein